MAETDPFAGLRVLDLTHFWSGPYLTTYLGAYGADVVKVESIQRPDGFRFSNTTPELGDDWFERSLLWQATNLNKRGVTLDLSVPDGRDLLLRLARDADVVVENWTPRVLDGFGLGYAELRARNRRIVLVRLPGFGLEGPWRDHVGWGDAFEQVGGFALVTGYPDGRPQIPGGYMDPMVAMHAAVALLAALEDRERTGEGRMVEVCQIEVVASMAAEQVIAAGLGHPPERRGNRAVALAPQGVYPCSGDPPEHVALSVPDDDAWRRLVGLVTGAGAGALRRAELTTLTGRHAHHDEIDVALADWTSTMVPEVAVALLVDHGIPAARVLRPLRYNDEPQLVAQHYYQVVTHPLSGPRLLPSFPMRCSFDAGGHRRHRLPAPTLGQHNHEVLCDELGLTTAEVAALEADGRIGTRPVGA